VIAISGRIKKTPTLLQMEAVECGAASLGMILGYYGKYVPLEDLRYECGVSRDGSNALNIIKAARHYGLTAKGLRMNLEKLEEINKPVIIFWGFYHFIVLEGIKKDYYYLNDPATGHRKCSKEEFEKDFTGIVLTFEPSETFEKTGKKTGSFFSVISDLSIDKKTLLFVFLCGFLLAFSGIMIPTFSRIYIDTILIPHRDEWLLPLLGAMLLVAFFTALVTYLQEKTLLNLENRIAVQQSSSFFYHLLKLPLTFFMQRYAGNLNATMTSGEQMATLLGNQFLLAFVNLVFSSFYILMMFQYDILLTLISITFTILNIVTVFIISKKFKEEYHLLLSDELKLSGIAVSGIQTIETLKATGQESIFFTRLADQYSQLQNKLFGITKKTLFFNSVPQMFEFISMLLLLLIGGLKIMNSSLTIGSFVAFQTLNAALYLPVREFIQTMLFVQRSEADKKRLEDVLKYPQDPCLERNVKEDTLIKKLSGKIEIKNLSFGYSRLEKPLIEDFNLIIEPGQRVALVGLSGSGKSTLGKLIVGLFQPWSGEILYDGLPLNQTPLSMTSASISYVEQDVTLFTGTVRENLTLWDPNISESDIIQAAKDACIHDEITTFAGKEPGNSEYAYRFQEFGNNISGGMRQRIEIARCLAKNPSILIMDEATSALDSKTELEIDLNIRKRGCSIIVISHRLSTIRDCDEIIVLDNGKVIERGKHEELMRGNSAYSKMVTHSQMKV